jgi:hypothetical protein
MKLMEVKEMGKKLKTKTSLNKLVWAFLQGVSLSGVMMGALLSESGLATPKPSETGFVQKAGFLGASRFCRDALAIEIAAIQTKPACAGFYEPLSPLTFWEEAEKISVAGTLSAGI